MHHGNPHLHGPAVPAAAHDKHHEHDHDDHHHHWHSHWYGRWNAWAYISLHRGLGSVTGTVEGGRGVMQVNLRKPGGHTFKITAHKHIVYTAANGNFLMTGVRAGAYRIVAHEPGSKHFGHSQVHVHTGHTSTVGIRL